MAWKRALVAAVLAACSAALAAQAVREVPPLYRGPVTEVQGVFVTPIAGAPFSAVVVIESKQPVAAGAVQTRRTQLLIARDSRGRIRNERHMMVPDSFHGMPPLLSIHIFDPATRISYFLNPATRIAREQVVPEPRRAIGTGNAAGEDLGYTTLNGMQAKGTRITRTIPAAISGTGQAVQVVDEFWYSEDLHMNLLERHMDVRGGVQTVAILTIRRDEPEASLFEVPEGYKVVDLTPPEGAPVRRGNGPTP